MHVLIVEDDVDTREALAELLQGEGLEVTTAPNGRVGLEELSRVRPSLVLLDVVMPSMSGWEFLQEKAQRPEADVPVVVMTAMPARNVEPGHDCMVLEKPFTVGQLIECLCSFERFSSMVDRGASAG